MSCNYFDIIMIMALVAAFVWLAVNEPIRKP